MKTWRSSIQSRQLTLLYKKQETDLEVDLKPPNFHSEFLQDCARERNLFLLCESLLKFARTVSKLSISVLPFWVRYDQNLAIFCMYHIFQTTHKILNTSMILHTRIEWTLENSVSGSKNINRTCGVLPTFLQRKCKKSCWFWMLLMQNFGKFQF